MNEWAALAALLGPGIKALRDAVGMMKDAKDLLPAGEKRKEAERLIAEVDAKIPAAEAQLAKALGYELCKCVWPPQPMLETGNPPRPRCPKCGRVLGELLLQLPAQDEAILQLLAQRPRSPLSAAEVASVVGGSEANAEFRLQSLEQSRMIGASFSMNAPPEYYLEQPGRAYLAQRGLL